MGWRNAAIGAQLKQLTSVNFKLRSLNIVPAFVG